MTEENQNNNQLPKVDESAITRESIADGAWAGMKKGMMWGGIGGIALTGMTMFFGFTMLKAGASAAPGLMGMVASIPKVGPLIAGVVGVGIAGGASSIMAGGMSGLALQALSMFATTAMTIGLPVLLAGALIGGIVGAVNGYSEADKKITAAENEMKREAKQEAMERQQTAHLQQQQQDQAAQFDAQSQQFASGGGQLSPGQTPNMNNNNSLVNNEAPKIG